MEKSIAGPIREFGEPESLFGVEPFHNCSDGRTGGCLEPGFAEARSAAKGTGLWVVGISAEVATPRTLKILISQAWFLTGWCQISSGKRLCNAPRVTDGWGLVDCDPG
jgi:hypothetical protein